MRLPGRRLQTAVDSLSLFSKEAKLKSILIINIHILENCRCFVLVFVIISKRLSRTKVFSIARQPPVGKGFLSIEAARLHSDTPQSVGLLWTSDQLYLTTHNIQNRRTSMFPAGFEPANPASEGPQTNALDRTATGTGHYYYYYY